MVLDKSHPFYEGNRNSYPLSIIGIGTNNRMDHHNHAKREDRR